MANVKVEFEVRDFSGGDLIFDLSVQQASQTGPVEILRDRVVVPVPVTPVASPSVVHTVIPA